MNILLYMDYTYGIIALAMIAHLIGGTDMSNRKKITAGAAQELALAAADYASAEAQRMRDRAQERAKIDADRERRNEIAIKNDENGYRIAMSAPALDNPPQTH